VSPAGAGTVYSTSFDTPTADLEETLAQYGLTNGDVIGVPSASVSGGVALVGPVVGGNGSLDIGSFPGDLVISLGVTTSLATPVNVNVGLRVGDNNLIFHPGYVAGLGAFRIDGPGGHSNTSMGFTPNRSFFSEMTVTIDADTGSTEIRIVDGGNPSLEFFEVFEDSNYQPGVTVIGLSAGSTDGIALSEFDYVTIESSIAAVPTGGPFALLLLGAVIPAIGVLRLR